MMPSPTFRELFKWRIRIRLPITYSFLALVGCSAQERIVIGSLNRNEIFVGGIISTHNSPTCQDAVKEEK